GREKSRRTVREERVQKVTNNNSNKVDEFANEVIHVIEGLPENYRLAISLHYLEGLSYGDIAKALTLSEVAARQNAKRGLEMVRKALDLRGRVVTAAAIPALLSSIALPLAPSHLWTNLSKIEVQDTSSTRSQFPTKRSKNRRIILTTAT